MARNSPRQSLENPSKINVGFVRSKVTNDNNNTPFELESMLLFKHAGIFLNAIY